MIDDAIKEEIKAKADLAAIATEAGVKLRKVGTTIKGLCPFHPDKATPSFTIYAEERRWHCFGCGKDGDVFAFVMLHRNVDFPTALRELAKRVGVELRAERPEIDALGEAAQFYHEALLKASEVLAYIEGRGITIETVKRFRLGWCDGQNLVRFMKDPFRAAGILENEYEHFAKCITFPHLLGSRVVYMTGRGWPEKKHRKIKSERVPLRHLYLEPRGESVVIAEGEFDALTLRKAGIDDAAAACGATSASLDRFERFKTITIAFDSDDAGRKATWALAEKLGAKARIAECPAKDWNEVKDPAAIRAAIADAKEYLEIAIERIPKGVKPAELAQRLQPILNQLHRTTLAAPSCSSSLNLPFLLPKSRHGGGPGSSNLFHAAFKSLQRLSRLHSE